MNTVTYIMLAVILTALYPLFVQGLVKIFKDVMLGLTYLIALIIRLYRFFRETLKH